MSEWRVLRGRIERWAAHYHGEPFHALLCDPPYALLSSGSRNGSQRVAGTGPYGRHHLGTKGFMGKEWDNEVAFDPDTWAALASHLYPGAFGMAFASSRGWHRLACAIEDAGLIIHPSIFGWAYGSGFPKATRVKDAPYFDGHRYGLQALKPALEPIIVWQKPYAGKPVQCITSTGAGALNIDGGRISANGETWERPIPNNPAPKFQATHAQDKWTREQMALGASEHGDTAGRWPANFFLQHLPGCQRVGTQRVASQNPQYANSERGGHALGSGWGMGDRPTNTGIGYADADGCETVAAWDCAPGCPVAALGEQSGERGEVARVLQRNGKRQMDGWGLADESQGVVYGDTGTAARFFFNADWSLDVAEALAAADPVRYVAKASRRERDAGLEAMPRKFSATMGDGIGAREHNPDEPGAWVRNVHPTVKPIALARWLTTLLLPPAAYAPRRLLVPFAGSGSEMIGATLAGWEYVLGIEGECEYAQIARARLAHWCQQPALLEAAA